MTLMFFLAGPDRSIDSSANSELRKSDHYPVIGQFGVGDLLALQTSAVAPRTLAKQIMGDWNFVLLADRARFRHAVSCHRKACMNSALNVCIDVV